MVVDAIESKIVADSLASNSNSTTTASTDVVAPVKVLTQKPQQKKLKITLKK